jgi:NADH dehydrogenase FAD-containing subunit
MSHHSYHTPIAIIWAWFAWLSSYIQLKKRHPDISIKLFNSSEHFTFIPSLHECLLKKNHLSSIQIDLRKIYGNDFIHEKIETIQPTILTTASWAQWTFDYAVIATWSRTNFFDNQSFAQHSYFLRFPSDIWALNQVLPTAQTISVIGWGYTWIEIASILSLRHPHAHIRLIHSRERLLHRLHPSCWDRSCRWLEKNNVEVILWQRVVELSATSLILDSGEELVSDVNILSSWIRINDQHHKPYLTFSWAYQSLESDKVYMCGDVATHGLYSTWHNAMIEGRRIGNLIADRLSNINNKDYTTLTNYDKLVISLGESDWVFSIAWRWYYLPRISGLFKKLIEKKVLREFSHKRFIPFT